MLILIKQLVFVLVIYCLQKSVHFSVLYFTVSEWRNNFLTKKFSFCAVRCNMYHLFYFELEDYTPVHIQTLPICSKTVNLAHKILNEN